MICYCKKYMQTGCSVWEVAKLKLVSRTSYFGPDWNIPTTGGCTNIKVCTDKQVQSLEAFGLWAAPSGTTKGFIQLCFHMCCSTPQGLDTHFNTEKLWSSPLTCYFKTYSKIYNQPKPTVTNLKKNLPSTATNYWLSQHSRSLVHSYIRHSSRI